MCLKGRRFLTLQEKDKGGAEESLEDATRECQIGTDWGGTRRPSACMGKRGEKAGGSEGGAVQMQYQTDLEGNPSITLDAFGGHADTPGSCKHKRETKEAKRRARKKIWPWDRQ